MGEDYSLEAMVRSVTAAKGRPLTPKEHARLVHQTNRLAELEKQLADCRAGAEEREREAALDAAIEEIKEEVKERTRRATRQWSRHDPAYGSQNEVVTKTEYEAAKARLKESLGSHGSAIAEQEKAQSDYAVKAEAEYGSENTIVTKEKYVEVMARRATDPIFQWIDRSSRGYWAFASRVAAYFPAALRRGRSSKPLTEAQAADLNKIGQYHHEAGLTERRAWSKAMRADLRGLHLNRGNRFLGMARGIFIVVAGFIIVLPLFLVIGPVVQVAVIIIAVVWMLFARRGLAGK